MSSKKPVVSATKHDLVDCTSLVEEAAEAVQEIIKEKPSLSMRQILRQLGCSKAFVHVCRRILKFYPHRVQLRHALQANDFSLRAQFCEWIWEKCPKNQIFLRTCSSATMHISGLTDMSTAKTIEFVVRKSSCVCAEILALRENDGVGGYLRETTRWTVLPNWEYRSSRLSKHHWRRFHSSLVKIPHRSVLRLVPAR